MKSGVYILSKLNSLQSQIVMGRWYVIWYFDATRMDSDTTLFLSVLRELVYVVVSITVGDNRTIILDYLEQLITIQLIAVVKSKCRRCGWVGSFAADVISLN